MRSLLLIVALLWGLVSVQPVAARTSWPSTVTALAHQVARIYNGAHVRITHVQSTQTDSTPHRPMYVVGLSGTFYKGKRVAHILDFSALANRTYIWGIVAYDGHHIVWTDPLLPGKHKAAESGYHNA